MHRGRGDTWYKISPRTKLFFNLKVRFFFSCSLTPLPPLHPPIKNSETCFKSIFFGFPHPYFLHFNFIDLKTLFMILKTDPLYMISEGVHLLSNRYRMKMSTIYRGHPYNKSIRILHTRTSFSSLDMFWRLPHFDGPELRYNWTDIGCVSWVCGVTSISSRFLFQT